MFGLILIAIFALIAIAGVGLSARPKKGQVSAGATPEQIEEAEELASLSEAAQHVVHEFRGLPEELQTDDIMSMVKALDLKYGVASVNSHFSVKKYTDAHLERYREQYRRSRLYGSYDNYMPEQKYIFSWGNSDGKCDHDEMCDYFEYVALREAIRDAKIAKREQDRALEIAGVQHDLDAVASLTARLREETGIMKSVTKELS